jgi:hypothetical protein
MKTGLLCRECGLATLHVNPEQVTVRRYHELACSTASLRQDCMALLQQAHDGPVGARAEVSWQAHYVSASLGHL